ncbi:hypothetical protein RDWZM_008883 [Blomia tropicalis]|uniref:Delta(3,5)-Delta(2,4)-dienoyl-CoA isomerase, mitochondrial n=1 Tax=Blomia tropicalis TaxID=40697 RepID=A0A9Q0M239_BLOTA|nr:hypothetical protein BLOT_004702 [Blomia tropicalis]KAJ6217726.1 hypothetical protein RDWZM_008883 [Blomia tropicalis]
MNSFHLIRFVSGHNAKNGVKRLFNHRNYSSAAYTTRYADYEHIQVTAPYDHVLHLELNKADKRNAICREMFHEIHSCFHEIANDKQCRAVVVSGVGKMFCSGIDYQDIMDMMNTVVSSDHPQRDDIASRAKFIRQMTVLLQNSFNSISKCDKPVIAAVHSGCIGAGLDLISAADIRYASSDSYFSIREVSFGRAADLGTLQRLPKIVGSDSLIRELAYTARDIGAKEAKEFGLVSRVFENPEACINGAIDLARNIALRSPVAVQGTKVALNYSRDHSEKDGLEFMQIWNMCMIQSEDFVIAATAVSNKQADPEFADL